MMQYQVVIVGGGMVGAALACLLGQAGLRVAVLERSLPKALEAEADFDTRVSALSRASQDLLTQIGAWQAVKARRASAYESMVVWDATGDGRIRFDAADLGEPDLGHIVENRVIQLALLEAMATYPSIELLHPASIQSFTLDEQSVKLQLQEGQTLSCQLLVGADGGRSEVRTLAKIETHIEDYAQKGLVCVVESSLPHQNTAWQRFMPTGPLAFLPLPPAHTSSIVWTLPADQADAYLQLDQAEFHQRLAEALDYELGAIETSYARAAFPLKGLHAKHYVQHRLALVGDAAHTIHPLAGQGVNLGFKDAKALADLLIHSPSDLGAMRLLRQYERSRQGDNQLTQKAMEGFSALFGNTVLPWQLLRNAGLSTMDKLTPLKYQIARKAMGL